jgi:circadian clock protein KaiB
VSKEPAPHGPRLSLVPKGDEGPPRADDSYRFTLYVAGDTPKSLAAIANLRKLCELHLAGRHSIEVIDLLKNPELAAAHQILAVPTLVRRLPAPIKRMIGSLADVERVLVRLELRSDGA